MGIVLFTAVVLFHLVTLPVEFNASARGLRILSGSGILMGDENEGAKKVLAGRGTHLCVPSAAGMILQLLRLLILTRGRRRE